MNELKLADLGEGMHEAEIVEWLVQVGDTVKQDQNVVKVETDKAIVEIPAPVSGRVSEIRVGNGQTARVGDVLVVFDAPASGNGSAASQASKAAPSASVQTPASSQAQSDASAVRSTTGPRKRALAAPAVRKLAFELGVDIDQVPPSSANGRVSLEDVRAFAERSAVAEADTPTPAVSTGAMQAPQTQQTTASEERQPLTGLRKRIAEHMERSWRIVPHATAFDEVDGAALAALRQSLLPVAEKRGVRLTYIPLLIKLLLPILKEFPIFNASLDEERREIIYKRVYHIGIATASPDGLLVPVLRDADKLTLLEIAARVEKLVEGGRKRTLSPSELSGSTFTLNNVGSFGGSSGTPIINYPEVAILAFGRLQEKAVVQNGAIVSRLTLPLAMSFDHRLIDGALSGAFLGRFKELVENPQQLLLDMV